MAQLKCYYFDFSGSLAESPFTYQLLGLNLLWYVIVGEEEREGLVGRMDPYLESTVL